MRGEHFGITIAEMMAYGIVMAAHNSAGPRDDLIGAEGTRGFLAEDEEGYVAALLRALQLDAGQLQAMQRQAMARGCQFGEQAFLKRVGAQLQALM
jgi:glycosyltransferase involved in cell wall biosynthesis